jgi:hypothetical protein
MLHPRCSSNQTEYVSIKVLCCDNTWSSSRLKRSINLLRIKQSNLLNLMDKTFQVQTHFCAWPSMLFKSKFSVVIILLILISLEVNNLLRIKLKQWNLLYLMDWIDEDFWSSNPFLCLTLDALQIKLNLFWCKFSFVITLDHHLAWREQFAPYQAMEPLLFDGLNWWRTFQFKTHFCAWPSNQTEFVLMQVLCCDNTWSSSRLKRTIYLVSWIWWIEMMK